MLILDGEVEMTIEDEMRTLGPGDVVVVNRGLHHTLRSPSTASLHGGARPRAARPCARTASSTSCSALTAGAAHVER